MDHFEIPELAVSAYERIHDLIVSIHDYSMRIRPRLATERGFHRHPQCAAAKTRDGSRACVAFDMVGIREVIPSFPDGLVQRCHAGLSEVVAPVRSRGQIVAVLFAGPHAVGEAAALVARQAPLTWLATESPRLSGWAAGEAETALECLRQLASRLGQWLDDAGAATSGLDNRRARIVRFIERRHQEAIGLADLARELRLSPDRAGHVVRQECGAPFLQLLVDRRLEQAAGMLRHTRLPVTEVCAACGFGDLSNFHRRFRRRFGRSPLQYRLRPEA